MIPACTSLADGESVDPPTTRNDGVTRTISVGTLVGLVLMSVGAGMTAAGQERDPGSELEGRVGYLERQIGNLERQIDRLDSHVEDGWGCGVAILFGAFCALWAQNTGRNPWLWFFMGAIFSCITVLFLLVKNADDLAVKAKSPEPPPEPDSVGFQEKDER